MTIDLILGTAGHIDHGKTALVRALTGVDTDRLPEEKKRGITIELGFAYLDLGEYRLGIVDVPGHERFVRNMLAGATGMDLAMLVVAADDSVKPQTREHLEILRLLNFETGLIAITKADLADPDWIELVEDEVRALTTGTFLADAPLVRTSAVTGLGLDTLRTALTAAAQRAARSQRMAMIQAPLRMAIDRSFTIAGHGTVVTGSVSSGRVRLGDELGAIDLRAQWMARVQLAQRRCDARFELFQHPAMKPSRSRGRYGDLADVPRLDQRLVYVVRSVDARQPHQVSGLPIAQARKVQSRRCAAQCVRRLQVGQQSEDRLAGPAEPFRIGVQHPAAADRFQRGLAADHQRLAPRRHRQAVQEQLGGR